MITLEGLSYICRAVKKRSLEPWIDPLNGACDEFEINTPKRLAACIAHFSHESGEFRYVRELASGDAYEGREDLGNTEPGDGRKFKGRGLIQITGRSNYAACGDALGLPLVDEPELLEQFGYAARASCWWWKNHGCNELADADNFKGLTRRINGGMNGYPDRVMYWERAKEAIRANS